MIYPRMVPHWILGAGMVAILLALSAGIILGIGKHPGGNKK